MPIIADLLSRSRPARGPVRPPLSGCETMQPAVPSEAPRRTALHPCHRDGPDMGAAALAGRATAWRRRSIWAVSLVDRESGEPHRVDGVPLVVLSKDRDLAIRDLMDGRDPRIWTPHAVRVARPDSEA
jgi:hypothetical protein